MSKAKADPLSRPSPSRMLAVKVAVGVAIFLFLVAEGFVVQMTFSARDVTGGIHGEKPKSAKDAADYLDLGEFGEVPVGQFNFAVQCSESGKMLHVYSKMDVLVAKEDLESFAGIQESRESRIREQVFMTFRTADQETLTDPALTNLKGEMEEKLNGIFDRKIVQDVLFPEYHWDVH